MSLRETVSQAKVVVSVGSGGVGKTTTAALIGMHAAREGRRVLVMTVDPARRLASALGMEGLDHPIRQVPMPEAEGEVWATMLDMKSTFDGIVRRYAPTDDEDGLCLCDDRISSWAQVDEFWWGMIGQ